MITSLIVFLKTSVSKLTTDFIKAVKNTPFFFWVYISVLVYVTNKLTYHHGYSKKKIKIGGRYIYINRAEEVIAENIVDISKISVCFSDIGGLEEVKKTLIEHVKWPFTRPQFFTGTTLRSHPKGVLLYGPPGTGKTLLARALAKELNCTFINVKTDFLFSKWLGDTEKNAAAVFTLAEKLSPCVIFIDEIDSFLGSRSNMDAAPHNHTKTIFMTNWDGINQCSAKVIIVGATNQLRSIDDAILRRLPLQIEVPPPDKTGREKILHIILKGELEENLKKGELIEYIVQRTEGYTGSDLTELCKAAALMPLREVVDGDALPPLEQRHFSEALKRVKPSLRI